MKILVIQQKMIGDVLTSSILFEVLRKEYPAAQLHYLVYPHTLPVVENNPFIDRLVLFEEADKKTSNFISFLKKTRKEQYDIVIDVYSKLGSAILSGASGAALTVSYEKWYTRHLYSRVYKRHTTASTPAGLAIENRLQLLEAVVKEVPKEIKPKIYLSDHEIATAKAILIRAGIPSNTNLIMVSVLGSSAAKTYPHEYLAALLDHIVEETGAKLLFNYIPKQLEEAQKIYNLCQPVTREHIFLDIFGKSLREFMALTFLCDALIGNEGGAVNMAKALDTPTFAIFSPSIEKQVWALYQNEKNVAVHVNDYIDPEKTKNISSQEAYLLFKPDLMLPELQKFLRTINKS